MLNSKCRNHSASGCSAAAAEVCETYLLLGCVLVVSWLRLGCVAGLAVVVMWPLCVHVPVGVSVCGREEHVCVLI